MFGGERMHNPKRECILSPGAHVGNDYDMIRVEVCLCTVTVQCMHGHCMTGESVHNTCTLHAYKGLRPTQRISVRDIATNDRNKDNLGQKS
jgi:hypothetical protein